MIVREISQREAGQLSGRLCGGKAVRFYHLKCSGLSQNVKSGIAGRTPRNPKYRKPWPQEGLDTKQVPEQRFRHRIRRNSLFL